MSPGRRARHASRSASVKPPACVREAALAIVGLSGSDERHLRAHEHAVDAEERDERVVTRLAARP
jgi:hypothetical protein